MLEFSDVSVRHDSLGVLKDVNFTVPTGSFCAVVGKNGVGKTTLVNCICRQQKYRGSIILDGVDIRTYNARELAQHIAVLPQLLPTPDVTVEELVSFGRNPYLGINRHLTENDRTIVNSALQQAGVSYLRHRLLPTLSGGERQKAFLAMTLAQAADTLIFDEPATYLDITAETEFLSMLKALSAAGKTLMVIMHNLSMAVKYADHIVILEDGRCVFSGSRNACLEGKYIEDTFGVRRVDAAQPARGEIFFTGTKNT